MLKGDNWEKKKNKHKIVCKLYFLFLQKFLNTIHNKFNAIVAIFWEFSLKQEQNIFYISFKKLYTFHLWTKRVFCTNVHALVKYCNLFRKNLQFSVITFTTSFVIYFFIQI